MNKVLGGGLGCDNYQFLMFDGQVELDEEISDAVDALIEQGKQIVEQKYYLSDSGSFAHFSTAGHANLHWFDVYLSEAAPDSKDSEQMIAVPMSLPSGNLLFCGPGDIGALDELALKCTVAAGEYCVYVLGYNIGTDIFSLTEDERDQVIRNSSELEQHRQLERYELYLVRGKCSKTGLLHSK